MDRRLRIGLIVVVVLALAYPAAAWLIGWSVQRQWQQAEQLQIEPFPSLTIAKTDYRRGVYGSTEEVTYMIGGGLVKSLQAMGQGWNGQFTVRHIIHHGPFPQLRDFAPATVDTEFVIPPQARAMMAKALGDKAGLTIHTRVKWFGGSTTMIHAPAFHQQVEGAGDMDWRGLEAKIELGREVGSRVVELTSPGMVMKTPKIDFSYENLAANIDSRRVFEVLNTGTAKLSLGRFTIDSPATNFKLDTQGLVLDSKSSTDGDFLNGGVVISMNRLDGGKFSASQMTLEVQTNHLHAPSMATLTKDIRAVQADQAQALAASPADPSAIAQQNTQTTQQLIQAFQTSGLQLLGHEPVIEFPRLGFKTPDGDFLLSLKLAVPGITPADVNGDPNALKMVFLKYLQATINVRMDSALFDKLSQQMASDPDKSAATKAQLQQMEAQGYVKVDGQALTTLVTFMNGQLRVNGLPFAPTPPPPPPPAVPPPGQGHKPLPGQRRNPH